MAGRRLRDAVKTVLSGGKNGENLHVVIAGLTNTYSQYVTTFEEYEIQRYEVSSRLWSSFLYFSGSKAIRSHDRVIINRKSSYMVVGLES